MSTTASKSKNDTLSYAAALGLVGPLIVTVTLNKPPFWAMSVGTAVAFLCAAIRLRQVRPAASFALGGLSRVVNVVILIALVSLMTAVWFSSGTIQGLMYYGLKIVKPRYVAFSGLALSTVLSTLIGSSLGTVATVGVAIMGIAGAFGVPLAPVAGAIMSGAIFGDRVSFLSPIYHLTVDLTGSDAHKATKRILASGWPALAACAVISIALGLSMDPGEVSKGLAWSAEFLADLQQTSLISAWVLLPTALVVVLAVRKVPVRTCLAAATVTAGAIAVLYQGESVEGVLRTAFFGYSAQNATPQVAALLRNGGLRGTVNLLLLLVFAGMYTGIMESSGMMDDVSRGLVSHLRTRRSFLVGAMGVSILSAALGSNQAMAVIIPARAMDSKRRELGVSPEDFAGAMSDSGVPAAGIIPWNIMAVMCSAALQVPPLAFAPYTVIAFALPLAGLWLMRKPGGS